MKLAIQWAVAIGLIYGACVAISDNASEKRAARAAWHMSNPIRLSAQEQRELAVIDAYIDAGVIERTW